MNREKILLEVLNEHGDFENVRQQFNENDLAVIIESMLRFSKLEQSLPIDNVKQRYHCPKCKGYSYDVDYCDNPSCPNMPCCGKPKELCDCKETDKKRV